MATILTGSKDLRWSRSALVEFVAGAAMMRLWGTLAWYDILTRYRRSVIGPFWYTLSVAIFVAALGVLYSTLFKMDIRDYMPFVAAGIVTWSLISAIVLESCVVFVEGEPIIKHTRLPLSIFVFRMIARNFAVFLHNLPVLVIVLVLFDAGFHWTMLLAPIGLALICINAVWLCVFLGIFGTRYRDVPPLVMSLLQVVFFITPIFWSPELLQGRAIVVDANPLYHLVEIVRAPILGQVPSLLSYAVAIGLAVVGATFSALLFAKFRFRIAYWL